MKLVCWAKPCGWHRFFPRTLDMVLVALVLGGGLVLYTVGPEFPGRQWRWDALAVYVWRGAGRPGLLLEGLATTLRLTFWATAWAMGFGMLAGLARVSSSVYLRLMGWTYVEFCRNIPPLVLVFLCYFFLGDQLARLFSMQDALRVAPEAFRQAALIALGRLDQVDAFATAAFTLGLYEGAYVAEIVRGGIESIGQGQWDAGQALGFSRVRVLWLVILPQAMRSMLPPLAGQLISTIKDSAIVSVISIQELTFQGMQIMATTYLTFEVWTCVAAMYFVLTCTCSLFGSAVEHWLERSLRTGQAKM